MSDAVMRHGNPTYMDFTPSGGNVAAGEVVLLGNLTGLTCGIAHLPIENAVLGALAIGGGVYECTMLENIAAYSKVYWDDSVNKLTNTSTNNATFGFLLEGGTGANTAVLAVHDPRV